MKLLLTNDDGIAAPGLATLQQAVQALGEVTVLAPDCHLSGCSHLVNTSRPLKIETLGPGRHAVDGSPADCARLGIVHLMPDVDWVLSGINDGGNLGVDVFMSGTVAAVREAALLGKRGIAFSQYRKGAQLDWESCIGMVQRVLDVLWSRPLPVGSFWNVNLPYRSSGTDDPSIVFCLLDYSHLQVQYDLIDGLYHYRGSYHQRPRQPGGDVDVCFSGKIAVTQLSLTGSSTIG